MKIKIVLWTAFMAVAGCNSAMPEVNDENCKVENIRKIEDKEMRQEFADRCFMRGTGTFKPSPEGK